MGLLSKFASNFNLRRYIVMMSVMTYVLGSIGGGVGGVFKAEACTRSLFSST